MSARVARVSALSRRKKRAVLLGVNVALIPVALLATVALLMAIGGLLSSVLGLPQVQLKSYESHAIVLTGVHAVLLGLAVAVLDAMACFATPVANFINFTLVYFLLAVVTRMGMLQILLGIYRRGQDQSRLLIYGAGATGRQLAAALRTDETVVPIAFIDDNVHSQGTIIQGLTVYGPMAIPTLIKTHAIDRVLLAMPSAPRPKQASCRANSSLESDSKLRL